MRRTAFAQFLRQQVEEEFANTASVNPGVWIPPDPSRLILIPLSPLSKTQTTDLFTLLRQATPFFGVIIQTRLSVPLPDCISPDAKEIALVAVCDGPCDITLYTAEIVRTGTKPVLGPWRTMLATDVTERLVDPLFG